MFPGFHEGEVDVEEAYANFTALPADLGLKGGKYLVDIGRFVARHPHTLPFLDRPLLVTEFFGEDRYSHVGINPSYLVDLAGIPLTLSVNALSGNVGRHEHAEEDSTRAQERSARFLEELTYTGRASFFFTLGKSTFLDLGSSAGTWVFDTTERLRTTWYGGDVKLKWRPGRRTSFTIEAEMMIHERDLPQARTLPWERSGS